MNISIKEETLGQRIRAARIRMGMTQEELAEEMCITKSMISYYENDHGDMKQSMIAEFADILGTTVEYLICGVIKEPELDADSVEILKLFGAMDEKTRQIMLVQMRAVAYI
jgi:transcriptional regulator with XRE-family HTH domain